jgi:hypothetical protein
MRKQAGIRVIQRHASFITGCFNAKYNHEASIRIRVGGL